MSAIGIPGGPPVVDTLTKSSGTTSDGDWWQIWDVAPDPIATDVHPNGWGVADVSTGPPGPGSWTVAVTIPSSVSAGGSQRSFGITREKFTGGIGGMIYEGTVIVLPGFGPPPSGPGPTPCTS